MEKQYFRPAWFALVITLACFGFQQGAFAYQEISISQIMDPKSGVSIEGGLPLAQTPPSGYCAIHLRIRNKTDKSHSWQAVFQSSSGGFESRYTTELNIGAGQTREWDLLIPRVNLNARGGMHSSMRLSLSGYGVEGSGIAYIPSSYAGYNQSAFVVMSESLARSAWSKIAADMKTAVSAPPSEHQNLASIRFSGSSRVSSRQLGGSQVNLAEMPPDWRAYAGVAGLWLSKVDWENLSSDRRRAIRQWVIAGGRLFVASTEDTIARLAFLPPDLRVGAKQPLGLGWIKAVKIVGGELPATETVNEVLALDTVPLPAWNEDYRETWALADEVGWPKLNVPMIIGFVVLFAIVIGPVNLRWFAPPNSRARLFFTIPMLSAGASIVLLGVIAIGDGFGGFGGRNVLLYLPAAENQVTLLQEQIARSRLLFGRSFKLPESVHISFAQQNRESDKGIAFERAGETVSGDWFRSRTVQSHVLRTTVPSRAEVILQPGSAADAQPVLLSSVATILRDVHYIDGSGRYWKTGKIDTGRPVQLEPSTREELEQWASKAATELSVSFRAVLKDITHRPGHFYAVADAIPEGPIETLGSFRWQKQNVLCFGTCTGAESK